MKDNLLIGKEVCVIHGQMMPKSLILRHCRPKNLVFLTWRLYLQPLLAEGLRE